MGALMHHVSICVTDMDRSLKLFRDILGFTLAWRRDRIKGGVLSRLLGIERMEADVAYLEIGPKRTGVEISRLLHPVMEDAPRDFGSAGTCSFGLRVDNLDELHARLAQEGWPPLSPCLDLNPPGEGTARAFCVKIEPGVLLELIEMT